MKSLIFVFVALAMIGCTSGPKKLDGVQEGHWRARALIKDLEQGRSYIVNLNLNALRGEKARMDVTSALGTGVASLLVDKKEVRYVLFDSKRFYYGAPKVEVMRPILAIPFDPRWLHNILFEIPLTEKGWTCVESGGFVSECRDSVNNIKVTWTSRSGQKRTIVILHQKATVQINVQSFEPKVEDRKNLFVLEAPQGYQKLRVR